MIFILCALIAAFAYPFLHWWTKHLNAADAMAAYRPTPAEVAATEVALGTTHPTPSLVQRIDQARTRLETHP